MTTVGGGIFGHLGFSHKARDHWKNAKSNLTQPDAKLTECHRVRSMRRYTKENCPVTPGITEPRCRVCTHPCRGLIEFYTLKGKAKRWIARQIPPDERGRKLDHRSICKHYQRHMFIRSPFLRN
jgi:hypothetical protein